MGRRARGDDGAGKSNREGAATRGAGGDEPSRRRTRPRTGAPLLSLTLPSRLFPLLNSLPPRPFSSPDLPIPPPLPSHCALGEKMQRQKRSGEREDGDAWGRTPSRGVSLFPQSRRAEETGAGSPVLPRLVLVERRGFCGAKGPTRVRSLRRDRRTLTPPRTRTPTLLHPRSASVRPDSPSAPPLPSPPLCPFAPALLVEPFPLRARARSPPRPSLCALAVAPPLPLGPSAAIGPLAVSIRFGRRLCGGGRSAPARLSRIARPGARATMADPAGEPAAAARELPPQDIVSQLQDEINGVCYTLFNSLGALQRDAPPLPVKDDLVLASAPAPGVLAPEVRRKGGLRSSRTVGGASLPLRVPRLVASPPPLRAQRFVIRFPPRRPRSRPPRPTSRCRSSA